MANKTMTIEALFKRQLNKQNKESDNLKTSSVIPPKDRVNTTDNKNIPKLKVNKLSLKGKRKLTEDSNIKEDEETNIKPINQESKSYKPAYYLNNYRQLLNLALENAYNKHLFNDEDLNIIDKFNNLNEDGQRMFVRLIQRKHRWIRLDKIKYDEMTRPSEEVLAQLAEAGFVHTEGELTEVETVLSLLYEKELRVLMKFLKIPVKPGGRAKMEASLLNPTSGGPALAGGYRTSLLKRTKAALGKCYRLDADIRRLFLRIILLSSLPLVQDVEEDQGGFEQLFTMVLVGRGDVVFPSYPVLQTCAIFSTRLQLIQYEEAKTLEGDLLNLLNKKDFEASVELVEKAKDNLGAVSREFPDVPQFLHKFSAAHVYLHTASHGIEVLQRLKRYKQAAELLHFLLQQKDLCQDHRGRWWERLALNWEVHLKDRTQSLQVLEQALQDPALKPAHIHSLLSRLQRLSPDSAAQLATTVPLAPSIPMVTIEGQLVPKAVPGRRNVFMTPGGAGDVVVVSVEGVALQHYRDVGYSCGVHGEGATMCSLFGLFLWDSIYQALENVFITPYQSTPLDLTSLHFLESRRESITATLAAVRDFTPQELESRVQEVWEAHHGESSLVSWDLFTSLSHLQGLVRCLGGQLIADICERLAADFRHWRSGAPDLVVWQPGLEHRFRFVEVKGPGDQLSSKQTLWLDFLANSCQVPAEVCYVLANGAKKLRKDIS